MNFGRVLTSVAVVAAIGGTVCPIAFASPSGEGVSSIKLRKPILSDSRVLDDYWFAAVSRIKAGDFATAQIHVDQLLTAQLDTGPRNLFRISDVVAKAAVSAAKKSDSEAASRFIEQARRLAPDSVRVSLASAQVHYLLGDFALGEIVRDVADSAWAIRTDLSELVTLRTHASGALMLTALLGMAFFGVFMLTRHGPRLVHNIAHLLPGAMRGFPVVILAISAFGLAPIALGFGVVPLALCWLLILAPYLSWSERFVGLLLSVSIACLPTLNANYARGLNFPTSVANAAYQCAYGRCSESNNRLLEAVSPGQPDYVNAQLALGLSRMHKGAAPGANTYILQGALNHMNAALKYRANDYSALVGVANAEYLTEMLQCKLEQRSPRLERVEGLYKKADSLPGAGPEAAFNMSGLQAQLGNVVEATQYMDRALAMDSSAVKHQQQMIKGPIAGLCPAEFGGNYRLMQPRPSAIQLFSSSSLNLAEYDRLLVPYAPLWGGLFSFKTIAGVAAPIGVFLIFFGFLGRFWVPAHRCETCGAVACSSCRLELKYLQVCERCLLVSVQGQLVDSRDQWLQQRRIKRRKRRHARYARIISFFVPGGAQFLLGRALSGVFYMGLVLAFGVVVGLGSILVPAVGWDVMSPLILSISAIILGLVYMAAQVDTWVST